MVVAGVPARRIGDELPFDEGPTHGGQDARPTAE